MLHTCVKVGIEDVEVDVSSGTRRYVAGGRIGLCKGLIRRVKIRLRRLCMEIMRRWRVSYGRVILTTSRRRPPSSLPFHCNELAEDGFLQVLIGSALVIRMGCESTVEWVKVQQVVEMCVARGLCISNLIRLVLIHAKPPVVVSSRPVNNISQLSSKPFMRSVTPPSRESIGFDLLDVVLRLGIVTAQPAFLTPECGLDCVQCQRYGLVFSFEVDVCLVRCNAFRNASPGLGQPHSSLWAIALETRGGGRSEC